MCSFAPLLQRKMRAHTKTQFFFKEFIVLYRVTWKAIVVVAKRFIHLLQYVICRSVSSLLLGQDLLCMLFYLKTSLTNNFSKVTLSTINKFKDSSNIFYNFSMYYLSAQTLESSSYLVGNDCKLVNHCFMISNSGFDIWHLILSLFWVCFKLRLSYLIKSHLFSTSTWRKNIEQIKTNVLSLHLIPFH